MTMHSNCTAVHGQRAREPRRDVPSDAALEQPLARHHRESAPVLHELDARFVRRVVPACLPLTPAPDADKQASIDVFLGLHDSPPPRAPQRGNYANWYNPAHLRTAFDVGECVSGLRAFVEREADVWAEYYRPHAFTPLGKHFAFGMNSTSKLFGCVLPCARSGAMLKARRQEDAGGYGGQPVPCAGDPAAVCPRPLRRQRGLLSDGCRLMDGVRRLIGHSPAPSPVAKAKLKRASKNLKISTASISAPSVASSGSEDEDEDVGAIARQLLRPSVSEKERAEYEWCVRSFRASGR